MTTKKSSGFVNPMDMKKVLEEQAGTEPLKLVTPQAGTGAQQAESPALPPEFTTKKEDMPWMKANVRVKVHFGLRMTEVLHHKFEYAANHTLGHSMQTFALLALEEAVDKRLKELGVL